VVKQVVLKRESCPLSYLSYGNDDKIVVFNVVLDLNGTDQEEEGVAYSGVQGLWQESGQPDITKYR
jgi:hypothetical protein